MSLPRRTGDTAAASSVKGRIIGWRTEPVRCLDERHGILEYGLLLCLLSPVRGARPLGRGRCAVVPRTDTPVACNSSRPAPRKSHTEKSVMLRMSRILSILMWHQLFRWTPQLLYLGLPPRPRPWWAGPHHRQKAPLEARRGGNSHRRIAAFLLRQRDRPLGHRPETKIGVRCPAPLERHGSAG